MREKGWVRVGCCPAVKEDHKAQRGRGTFYEAISNRVEEADKKIKIKREAVRRFSTDRDLFAAVPTGVKTCESRPETAASYHTIHR